MHTQHGWKPGRYDGNRADLQPRLPVSGMVYSSAIALVGQGIMQPNQGVAGVHPVEHALSA
jgi:hypothetical protein